MICKKTILITGSGGFLGRHLLKALENLPGYHVIAASSTPKKIYGDVDRISNAHLLSSDFSFKEIDLLLHCAFPRQNNAQFAEGLRFSSSVLGKAAMEGVGALVYISSQSVYTRKRTASASEDTPILLDDVYAAAKYSTELLIQQLYRNIPYTCIRLASLIGPEFEPRVTNQLVRKALEEQTLTVLDAPIRYGLLDIDDAVRGISLLLRSEPTSWEPVYNLAGVGSWTLSELAQMIQGFLHDQGIPITVQSLPSDRYENTALNGLRFEQDFGFHPQISMQQSIQRIVAYQLREGNANGDRRK